MGTFRALAGNVHISVLTGAYTTVRKHMCNGDETCNCILIWLISDIHTGTDLLEFFISKLVENGSLDTEFLTTKYLKFQNDVEKVILNE